MVNTELKNLIEKVSANVDAEYMDDFIHEYIKIGDSKRWGGIHGGSDSEHKAADFIMKKLQEIGIEHIDKVPVETSRIQFNDAVLELAGMEIYPYGYTAPGCDKLTAEIVDVKNSQKMDYKDIDVTGKIVILEAMGFIEGASLSCQIQEAELHGAAAVIVVAVEEILNEETIRVQPLNYIAGIPVVGVCQRDANMIKEAAITGEMASLTVDAIYEPYEGTTYEIVAEIRGSKTDEKIIYSCHYDHYFRCIQDDVSAAATLLGIAKAMMDSGYRPEKTITFIFNGSHETGNVNSRYPYIAGSYRLLDGPRKDIAEKGLVDFNFEYTALDLKNIKIMLSHENKDFMEAFAKYIPDSVKAFKPVYEQADSEDYYVMSWADTISYISKGIPVVMNDALTEQLYEGISPYIGRDHSNHDNFDSYSKADLKVNTQLFAAAGVYVASKEIIPFAYEYRIDSIYDEDDAKKLRAQGIDTSSFEILINGVREKAAGCKATIENYNAGKPGMVKDPAAFNRGLKKINGLFAETFDKIGPQDFIIVQHKKSLGNIAAIEGVQRLLRECNIQDALVQLKGIDIASTSYFFSPEILLHTLNSINGKTMEHTRLWAKGRETMCLTMEDVMDQFHRKEPDTDFIIKRLEHYKREEKQALKIAVANEIMGLERISAAFDELGI